MIYERYNFMCADVSNICQNRIDANMDLRYIDGALCGFDCKSIMLSRFQTAGCKIGGGGGAFFF